MDYSDLLTAVKSEDRQQINDLLDALRPRLMAFLCIHMNAGHSDAEDCVQETLITILDVAEQDRLENPDHFFSYLLTICKNNYLKLVRNRHEEYLEETTVEQKEEPRQLTSLLDKEQKELLAYCLKQLRKEYQKYMVYWFENPDAHTKKVAQHFNISVSNAWTRKHRLIKKLHSCYQEKINF